MGCCHIEVLLAPCSGGKVSFKLHLLGPLESCLGSWWGSDLFSSTQFSGSVITGPKWKPGSP